MLVPKLMRTVPFLQAYEYLYSTGLHLYEHYVIWWCRVLKADSRRQQPAFSVLIGSIHVKNRPIYLTLQ